MDLKNKSLVEWLKKHSASRSAFPFNGSVDYYNRYISIKEYLDNHVHPEINAMTLKFEDSMYLTKHGTEHIDVVIKRLGELVNSGNGKDIDLSPYEIYLLLVATQLHDTGHVKKGREQHEANSKKVMDHLGTLLGTETAEKKVIWTIAQAHGGRTPDGKKDKIEQLPISDPILGFTVKQRMLAALLRLADELSDDYTRASRLLLDTNAITKASEIFHVYASVLHSVVIDHKGCEIKLEFLLEKKHLTTRYGKGDKEGGLTEVFLIDEIYERLYKMYLEFTYCMRFINSFNKLNTITAKITFMDGSSYVEFRPPIVIKLRESGYPSMTVTDLYGLCPDALIADGVKVNGEYFSKSLMPQDVY